jgi:hypothetical protein
VPVTVPLAERGVLGIAGPGPAPRTLAGWLVCQATVLHSPTDLAALPTLHDPVPARPAAALLLRQLPQDRLVTQPTARSATPVAVPPAQRRRDVTVYSCPSCQERFYGQQWCHDCNQPCTRVGLGGLCPNCESPVAHADLGASS